LGRGERPPTGEPRRPRTRMPSRPLRPLWFKALVPCRSGSPASRTWHFARWCGPWTRATRAPSGSAARTAPGTPSRARSPSSASGTGAGSPRGTGTGSPAEGRKRFLSPDQGSGACPRNARGLPAGARVPRAGARRGAGTTWCSRPAIAPAPAGPRCCRRHARPAGAHRFPALARSIRWAVIIRKRGRWKKPL